MEDIRPYTPLEQCPEEVQRRLQLWTSDVRQFSTKVIAIARQNYPHSNAYKLGDVTAEQTGFLGTGINAKTPKAELQVPNPANIFRLHWHKAILKVKGDPDSAPTDEETAILSKMHALESLRLIKKLVANNTNYNQQRDRYPSLQKLCHSVV